MNISALLVDDHKVMRAGLATLLAREKDIDVVGEAGDGLEALRLVGSHRPDVVVMDIGMPNMNGIEATRRLVAEFPGVRVLALSIETDRRFVVEVLKSGAWGYLVKDCAAEELVAAIRTVVAGEHYLPPRVTQVLIREYLQRIPDDLSLTLSLLTNRETEVLQLIAEGRSTKEIAFRFGVSLKTVETQRQQIMKKLNLFSIAELTKYAVRQGLTSLR